MYMPVAYLYVNGVLTGGCCGRTDVRAPREGPAARAGKVPRAPQGNRSALASPCPTRNGARERQVERTVLRGAPLSYTLAQSPLKGEPREAANR